MSQRDSGYERKERDLYETPEWVTAALLPHMPFPPSLGAKSVWEPACGNGKMATVLALHYFVSVTDIEPGPDVIASFSASPLEVSLGLVADDVFKQDFLVADQAHLDRRMQSCGGIVTNPPYELAKEFCEHALRLMEPRNGFVAMLLRTDFDHAKSRSHLFRDCPAFAKKLVLTRRIVWFEPAPGAKGKSPSFNHAWFIWDWKHEGPPTIGYGP